MDCSNVTPRLTAYLAHELPLDERSLVRQHLEQCQECQGELSALGKLDRMLDLQPVLVPPDELGESILAAIAEQQVNKPTDLTIAQVAARATALVAGLSLVLLPLLAWWWKERTGLSFLESAALWNSTRVSGLSVSSLWSMVLAARQWLLVLPTAAADWIDHQFVGLTRFYGRHVLLISLATAAMVIVMAFSLRTLSRCGERWSEGADMKGWKN